MGVEMKLDASDIYDLKPLLATFARELLAEIDADAERGRLAFTEKQAAEAIGVPSWKLRDCRLRGELRGRLVGRTMVYSRDELQRFLQETR
jgi:hypothetical protein